MATVSQVDIRPRTTGEILDDAVRLGLADAGPLLALSGSFLVPAFVVLLLMLALPSSGERWQTLGLPALAAVLLPLTGIGSGACQELFRRRASDTPVSLRGCLGSALGRGLDHVAVRTLRTLTIPVFILGLFLFIVPGLALWSVLATGHAWISAGEARARAAVRESARALQRNSFKVMAVTFARLAATTFVALNLHVAAATFLWIAGNLGGLDTALLGLQLSLGNPAYLLTLVLLAWWLFSPVSEGSYYLLHLDTRVRYEGLDLWYSVQRLFALTVRGRTGVAAIVLAIWFVVPGSVQAQDRQLKAIQNARQGIAELKTEIGRTAPPARDAVWKQKLDTIGGTLKGAGDKPERYVWYDKAVEEFGRRSGTDAVQVLDRIDARLALIEDGLVARDQLEPNRSAGDIRKLLPEAAPAAEEKKKPPEEPKPKEDQFREIEIRGGHGGGFSGAPIAGFSMLGWFIIVGLLVACVAVGIVLFIQERKRTPKKEIKKTTGEKKTPTEENDVRPDQIAPAALWAQADELAQQGKFLEAVRRLYLAVLALLHRSRLIRYEKTRTNGEYIRQLRRATEAPPAIHPAFVSLTGMFDQKWYGDRACDDREYGACRELAEQVRTEVKA
jgi:hypothetical protein